MTNGDRIRSLPDEELAWWLILHRDICLVADMGNVRMGECARCIDCMLPWLKEEAQED